MRARFFTVCLRRGRRAGIRWTQFPDTRRCDLDINRTTLLDIRAHSTLINKIT